MTIAFSLYTHLFSILVAIGHGVYTLIIEKFRLSQKLVSYLIFSLLALFIYLPWILVIFLNWKSFTGASSWIQEKGFNLGSFLTITNNIIHSFIDFWYAYTYLPNLTFPHLRFAILIKPILVILIAYSVYFLYRSTKREVWLFVLTLLGTTPLLLILKDLATGSGSSGVSRYIIPCYLGIQISVAYLFTNRLSCTCLSSWQRRAWQIVIFLLISGGILSSFVSSQAETWSTKYYRNQHQLAKIINQATNPLVISDSSPNSVFSLAHHLDSKVQLELLVSPNQLQIPSSFSDVFLFETSEKLRQSLKEREDYQVVSVKKIINLWQLKKY